MSWPGRITCSSCGESLRSTSSHFGLLELALPAMILTSPSLLIQPTLKESSSGSSRIQRLTGLCQLTRDVSLLNQAVARLMEDVS